MPVTNFGVKFFSYAFQKYILYVHFFNLAGKNSVGNFLCSYCNLYNQFQDMNLTFHILMSKDGRLTWNLKICMNFFILDVQIRFYIYLKEKSILLEWGCTVQSQRYRSIYIFYVPCSRRIRIISFSLLNTTWVLEVTIESFYVLDFPWIFKDFCVSTSLFLSLTSSRFMLDSYPWKLYH